MGLPVAALYRDMAWHRGKVMGVREAMGMVEIEYMDWGWRAFVRSDTVRGLDKRFGHLPGQAVRMRWSDMRIAEGINWDEVVRLGRGKGLVIGEKKDLSIELFMRIPSEGKKMHNQRSRQKASHRSEVVKQSNTSVEKSKGITEQDFALGGLISASLARIRERERERMQQVVMC